jgi:hypothetical protein
VVLDSDAAEFGGAGSLTTDALETVAEPHLGRDQHIELTLAPLSTLMLKRIGGRPAASEEPATGRSAGSA